MWSKKSFVSLAFTYKKLQFLQLNAAKTKVEQYGTVDLPANLINNYKVADKTALIKILKETWQNFRLKEKTVGIIIPEFSTFTKNITLPLLEIKELDEAVRWQAQDFLPLPLEQIVMDWKIIRKVDNNYQVLVVAIEKEILASFVDAVGEAGLFPQLVEIPSVALSRIADAERTPKLVIYINSDEAILVLAQGEEIIGSSVVNAADHEGILWTAINISKHYHDVPIQRLEIGGLKFTQRLIDNLQQNIGKPTHWIQPNVSGLASEQIQEYLLPLSLQYKDPAEPASETTINLLPKDWVEKYKKIKLKTQSLTLLVIVTIVIWGCLLSTLGAYLMIRSQLASFQKTVAQTADIPPQITAKITQINETSAKILTINTASIQPQEILNAVLKAKPGAVSFSLYKIDLDTGKITLKGRASDRQTLLKFKQSLEENKNFEKVNIPISTLEMEQNIDFEMSFNWRIK